MRDRLVVQIENHLGWGPGQSWTNKDFSNLSEKIFEVTGKQLSVTTLKRVWGRVEPISNPSITTFDILSEFLGYENWRHYQQSGEIKRKIVSTVSAPQKIWQWGIGVAAVLVLVLIFWRGKKEAVQKSSNFDSVAQLEDVSFSYTKVTTGYPNTVIFKYDLGGLTYDTLSIQQSWDTSKRIPLADSKGLVTSTYYEPGYYLAKLVVDDQIVEERDLYIPTLGWQGMILGEEGELSYLKTEVLKDEQGVGVNSNVLEEMEQLEESNLYLANLSDSPTIEGGAFRLKTVFRTKRFLEGSICQNTRMIVTGTREVISLAFSAPGCVGDLVFFMDNEMVSGRNHDFSAFGIQGDQWMQCELVVEDKLLKVLLQGEEAFRKKLNVDLGQIGGVQWYFEGLGEIRELTLTDAQQQISLVTEE